MGCAKGKHAQATDKHAHNSEHRLAQLLNMHSTLRSRNCPTLNSTAVRMRALLGEFAAIRKRVNASEEAQAGANGVRLNKLLNDYEKAVESYRLRQERCADDFNLLAVMQLGDDEIIHSRILAWLLDRDMRKLGTHAQGNLGFRLFLNEFDLPARYASHRYWVYREVAGADARIDIEVACRGRFLIHIENKIWSCEGVEQTEREWNDICRRGKELAVPEREWHGLFLTPGHTPPDSARFQSISWQGVLRVLEEFTRQAKPLEVKLFARHYAEVVRRSIVKSDTSGGGTWPRNF